MQQLGLIYPLSNESLRAASGTWDRHNDQPDDQAREVDGTASVTDTLTMNPSVDQAVDLAAATDLQGRQGCFPATPRGPAVGNTGPSARGRWRTLAPTGPPKWLWATARCSGTRPGARNRPSASARSTRTQTAAATRPSGGKSAPLRPNTTGVRQHEQRLSLHYANIGPASSNVAVRATAAAVPPARPATTNGLGAYRA